MPDHGERCRELAEKCVAVPFYEGGLKAYPYDERFASLRGEHGWGADSNCVRCKAYLNPLNGKSPPPYCLRTEGDALDEAIAACGFDMLLRKYDDGWYCHIATDAPPYGPSVSGYPTPREAKSAALHSAIFNNPS
jgi:hypothetical protein